MRRYFVSLLLALLIASMAAAQPVSTGGPVLIGGDDADDHGYFANGLNQSGWLYIEDGFNLIGPEVRNGNNTVVCLGCDPNFDPTAGPALVCGCAPQPCSAPNRALDAFRSAFDGSDLAAAGWTRVEISGTAALQDFFAGAATARKPG